MKQRGGHDAAAAAMAGCGEEEAGVTGTPLHAFEHSPTRPGGQPAKVTPELLAGVGSALDKAAEEGKSPTKGQLPASVLREMADAGTTASGPTVQSSSRSSTSWRGSPTR